jgi:hypothetical protein
MTADTFDTDSTSFPGITFSGGNLVATCAAGPSLSNQAVAWSMQGKSSGKYYVEMTCGGLSGNQDCVGLVPAYGIHGGFVGDDSLGNGSWGYYNTSKIVYQGSTQTAVNLSTYTTGDIIGIAIDLDNKKIWWNKNGGSWIGTAGTPNPATNTGGFDITMLVATGIAFVVAGLSGSGSKFTANFGATAFSGSVPAGFTSGWSNTSAGTYFGSLGNSGYLSVNLAIPNGSGTGNMSVSKWTSTLTGSLTSVNMTMRSSSNTCKCVIYDATGAGGGPGALLGVSTAESPIVGLTNFPFSGVSVSNGTVYWIGVIVSGGNGAIDSPGLSGGTQNLASTYATPANPFGAPGSASAGRYPMQAFVLTSSTETANPVTLALSGISYGIAAYKEPISSAILSLSKVSFNAGTARTETSTIVLALGPISFQAQAALVETATANLNLNGVALQASVLRLPPAGSGKRTFWTFGA